MTDNEKLPLKLKKQLVSLVGEKPLVNVNLSGVQVEGLMDTGSQISAMDDETAQEKFPGVEIIAVEDFVKNDQKFDSLKITTANQSELKIKGVMVWILELRRALGCFKCHFW